MEWDNIAMWLLRTFIAVIHTGVVLVWVNLAAAECN